MFDSAEKLLQAGLGAISMTRDKADKIFDDYVRRGQAEQKDRSGFVKDLMDSAEKVRHDLEEIINKQVRQTLTTLEIATRDDLLRLESKVDQLLSRESESQTTH